MEIKFIVAIMMIVLLTVSGCRPADISVSEIGVKEVSYQETIHLDNCGGKAESEQTSSRSFATSLDFKTHVNVTIKELVEVGVEGKYGQYRDTSKSMKVVAPPGTNMEFVLKWTENDYAGNAKSGGELVDYTVRVPLSVEQSLSRDLGCGNSSVTTPLNTKVTQLKVLGNSDTGVKFQAAETGYYTFRYASSAYSTGPNE